jgi:hypothetical protein
LANLERLGEHRIGIGPGNPPLGIARSRHVHQRCLPGDDPPPLAPGRLAHLAPLLRASSCATDYRTT